MTSDGVPVGRLLCRRDLLRLLAGSAASLMAGTLFPRWTLASTPGSACVVRPEQTEGPYFVDERLNRSDIRSDPTNGQIRTGTPLTLTVLLSRINGGSCHPLADAQVDIWHCDALGIYSDVEDPRFNTIGQKFLRGYQLTAARGEAKFLTIYPGWYQGRTVHIHVKVRTNPTAKPSFETTPPMYFDDVLSDRVYADTPYATKGKRTARNQDDRIFRRGGDQLLLAPTETSDGLAATFAICLQLP